MFKSEIQKLKKAKKWNRKISQIVPIANSQSIVSNVLNINIVVKFYSEN